MATPIIEQIAVKIKAVLETITIAAGYEIDVAEVVRPNRTGSNYAPTNYLIVMLQDDPLEAGPPVNRLNWIQPFYCYCYVIDDEDSTDAYETKVNLIRSDVEKALMTLLDDPTFRGVLAENVTIREPERFITTNGDYEGVRVVADILYRTLETNPYSKT